MIHGSHIAPEGVTHIQRDYVVMGEDAKAFQGVPTLNSRCIK